MNYSNIVILVSTLIIAMIFFGSVLLNLHIKSSKEELYKIQQEIDQLKLDIKRQKIEITTLTNPLRVYEYIEKKGYKAISIKNMEFIYLNR